MISWVNTPPTIVHTGLNSEKQCLEEETHLADENSDSGSDTLPHRQAHTRELEVSDSVQVLLVCKYCLSPCPARFILGEFFGNDFR